MEKTKLTNREKYYLMTWLFMGAVCLFILSVIIDNWKLPNKTYSIVAVFFMFVGFWYGVKFGSRSFEEETNQH